MEVKEKKKKEEKKNNKLIIFLVLVIVVLVVVFVIPNKEGRIKTNVKTSLVKLVEKSDLETVNFNYNVIAKKCMKEENCDLNSNNIKDFEYVLSCTGTVTAGIDFDNVKIDVNNQDKKIIITMPDFKITEENVKSLKFLNGEDVSASELPEARSLCKKTIKEKSSMDDKILPAAKEQAEVVLQSFYEQWVKAFDEEYKVEIR